MAIIDFFSEREKRQSNKTIDYRERIRSHNLKVFFATFGTVVGIILLVAVLNVLWKEKTYTDVSVVNSSDVSVVTGASALNLKGSLLIYSKDGVSCVDSKGKAVWNESYEMQSPIVSINGSTVAIGDYNGRNIYVANNSKILGTVKTNLPIRAIAVADTGAVAAVLDDSNIIRIYIYDGNSNTETPIVEAKATMNKSGYPISVALSPNGKLMMVSYLYVDSGSMKTSVSFYNFGDVGNNKVDNFVSGFDYDNTITPYVDFMDSDSAFCISDDRIVFFNGGEIPDVQGTALLSEKVKAVYHSQDYVGLVFLNTDGESLYRLDVYNSVGKKINSLNIDFEYTDIEFNKNEIVIYGGNVCNIVNVKGNTKYSGLLPIEVRLMIPVSSYKYQLVGENSMQTIEFN